MLKLIFFLDAWNFVLKFFENYNKLLRSLPQYEQRRIFTITQRSHNVYTLFSNQAQQRYIYKRLVPSNFSG